MVGIYTNSSNLKYLSFYVNLLYIFGYELLSISYGTEKLCINTGKFNYNVLFYSFYIKKNYIVGKAVIISSLM